MRTALVAAKIRALRLVEVERAAESAVLRHRAAS
jgi:hypothetical protein